MSRRGWESSAAIDALDRAGLSTSDKLAERLVEMLEADGHRGAGAALDAEAKAIASDLPELFGGEPDDDEVGDEFGHLHPEGEDLRNAEVWRELNRAGFSGSRGGMRRMAKLIGPVTGPLVGYAVADLLEQAPEVFWEDVDLEDDVVQDDEVDDQAVYEEWIDAAGPTYEGPLRDGPPGLVGTNAANVRTSAALRTQAGVRPAPRGRAPRLAPRDSGEATTDRLLRSAGY